MTVIGLMGELEEAMFRTGVQENLPPTARSLGHGADIGLHLLPEDSFEEIRAHLISLVDTAMVDAAISIGAGELPSDFLEGAHVTLRFAP